MLDTISLGRRPGSMRTVERVVTAPARIGLELIAIEEGAEIELDLRLEAVSEGVLVTGSLRADTAGECSRCLEPFSDSVDLALTELFAYPDSATEETTEEGEVYHVEDDKIDLEPFIIDAVGLALPFRPLCSDDCQGLCSECGVRLAIAESGHGHDILDPRWAGLAAKFGVDSGPSKNLVNTEAEEK
ncbi:YceD family protein [Rhodococcus sp. WMMA185]|uniref:YceD family protein n=1 Tax=Rhodococcus sp. WMMA185 TaxID=679318 RepID=UPI00087853D4